MNLYPKIKRKSINKQATRKYTVQNVTIDLEDKFSVAQIDYTRIYNIVIKYLYQHYGVKKLNVFMPMLGVKKQGKRNISFYIFVGKIVDVVIKRLGKNVIFNRQAINRFVETIVRNFDEYRKKQKKVQKWSNRNKERYLNTHHCTLSGYGRLNYQHDYDHFQTITLVQNIRKGRRNTISIIDNHHIKIPYFGLVHTKQSLKDISSDRLVEAKIRYKKDKAYELQLTTKKKVVRQINFHDFKNAVGGDINSKNDEFFCFSDGYLIKWNPEVKKQYKEWDKKSHAWQKYITKHKYDNNYKLVYAKKQKQHCETKKANIMINWYRQKVVPNIVKRYPVLVMERLHTIRLRINRYKQGKMPDKLRQNINNKLNNIIRPTTFLNILIDAYQKAGRTLILVDPTDTSKTCHYCNHINHDLGREKKWICPNCGREIKRDFNSTLNIRDWGIDPDRHIVIVSGEFKRHPWVNKDNLVTIY